MINANIQWTREDRVSYLVAYGVQQQPEVSVLLGVFVHGLGIEHESVRNGEKSWYVKCVLSCAELSLGHHAISALGNAGDLHVEKGHIVENQPCRERLERQLSV